MATLFVKAGIQQSRAVQGENLSALRLAYSLGTASGWKCYGVWRSAVERGEPYHGEVEVVGTVYYDYEPIKDASGKTIGAYFVGHK